MVEQTPAFLTMQRQVGEIQGAIPDGSTSARPTTASELAGRERLRGARYGCEGQSCAAFLASRRRLRRGRPIGWRCSKAVLEEHEESGF